MGLSFFDIIKPKNGKTKIAEVSCRELFESARELQIRTLCYQICVNMIANAIGRCEFKTFKRREEVFDREYYLWNYEPNMNQNSTVFLHQLVSQLLTNNEALVIEPRKRGGTAELVVADAFDTKEYVSKQNEYTDVRVGDYTYTKSFRENDVLHLKLNNKNVQSVLDQIALTYGKMIAIATDAFNWSFGKHWKVHVNQIAQGGKDWAADFGNMITEQFKPFLQSQGAILPEFDGYEYKDISGGASSGNATNDLRNLVEDIFNFTARGFLIPVVLVNGKVESTSDANQRFLTNCIDPICDQLNEEITRKRYGFDDWKAGDYLRVDSSSIIHFDLFAEAASVEKLVGSGVFTINDVRRAAGQTPINEQWADRHYMTLNISGVENQTAPLDA